MKLLCMDILVSIIGLFILYLIFTPMVVLSDYSTEHHYPVAICANIKTQIDYNNKIMIIALFDLEQETSTVRKNPDLLSRKIKIINEYESLKNQYNDFHCTVTIN